MGRVGEKGGFPRLPFGKTWPDDRQIARIVDGAQDADALRALFRLLGEYRRCESANQSFQARLWGEADQSEYQSEHWNYVRNSDFTQGANGDSRWTVPGGVSAGKVTTGLPKGARNALQVFHAFGVPKSLTQSASATGQTWYVVGGWVRPISGQYAGVMVTENSGSSTARTHAWRFRPGDGTPWHDLRSPLRQPLAFVTYKGTTKVTTALIVAANGQAMFSQMSLEKGRRAHPWRPHFLDRGNLITSIKTAGSASFYGNVTLSASGTATIRQVAPRKFVIGASGGGGTPAVSVTQVSGAGSVGTGTNYARQDHVHRGVKFIRTAGSNSFSGSVTFSGGGAVRIRQAATRKFVFSAAASVSLASTTPGNVSSAGTVGVGTTAARADHVHRGVTSIFKAAGASADGRVGVVGSGGATVQVLSGNLRVHAPAAGVTSVAATAPIASSGGTTPTISLNDDGVTYAKIQNVSATDKVLGRSTAGAGDVEEIPCTAAGRALLDDANAAAQRATLDVPSTTEAVLDTIIDAKGDLIVGTAADTPARLAVGTNGYVLTADSGEASGVKWAAAAAGSLDITGLTAADPALGDELPIYDVSATANRKVTIEELGFILTGLVGGRLTLTSGTSVTTSDVTAAGTLYYAIHEHDKIALYDGTRWKMYTFTERSLSLTITSGKNYDVFMYDNAGTLTLELSSAWTNDTTRADALTTQDGVLVKSGATTRRYLGTIRASASNATEDSATKRFVWNAYNRVRRTMYCVDTADNWSYTTATWRQSNANAAMKVEYVCGLSIDPVRSFFSQGLYNATGAYVANGTGVDSTTVNSAQVCGAVAYLHGRCTSEYNGYPGIGYHYLAALEISQAAGTTLWYGDGGAGYGTQGFTAEMMA